jgi:hypothetical protein
MDLDGATQKNATLVEESAAATRSMAGKSEDLFAACVCLPPRHRPAERARGSVYRTQDHPASEAKVSRVEGLYR